MDRMCDIRMIRGDKLIATTSAFVMRLGRVYLSTIIIIILGSAPSFLNGLTLGHVACQS